MHVESTLTFNNCTTTQSEQTLMRVVTKQTIGRERVREYSVKGDGDIGIQNKKPN